MKEMDEIREIYKDSTTPWSEHVRVLLSALDERGKKLAHYIAERDKYADKCRELEEEVKKLKEFPQKLRELAKALAPDGGEKEIDCFIGDKIKDKIREGGQAPVVDKATLAKAKEEADIYLSKPKPVCGTCKGTRRVLLSMTATEKMIAYEKLGDCPDCTGRGEG